jgi:hypothetical protein
MLVAFCSLSFLIRSCKRRANRRGRTTEKQRKNKTGPPTNTNKPQKRDGDWANPISKGSKLPFSNKLFEFSSKEASHFYK